MLSVPEEAAAGAGLRRPTHEHPLTPDRAGLLGEPFMPWLPALSTGAVPWPVKTVLLRDPWCVRQTVSQGCSLRSCRAASEQRTAASSPAQGTGCIRGKCLGRRARGNQSNACGTHTISVMSLESDEAVSGARLSEAGSEELLFSFVRHWARSSATGDGATPEQGRLLLLVEAVASLSECGQSATVSAVASEIGIDQSDTSRLVKSAVEGGYVAMTTSICDRRRREITLMSGGDVLLREAHAQHEQVFDELTVG